jgi:hypothetical protein
VGLSWRGGLIYQIGMVDEDIDHQLACGFFTRPCQRGADPGVHHRWPVERDGLRQASGTQRPWDVDLFDVATIQVNFGKSRDATWTDGDFDGNGTVDIFDVAAMQPNYGTGVANAPIAVPEASTMLLGVVGMLCCLAASVFARASGAWRARAACWE